MNSTLPLFGWLFSDSSWGQDAAHLVSSTSHVNSTLPCLADFLVTHLGDKMLHIWFPALQTCLLDFRPVIDKQWAYFLKRFYTRSTPHVCIPTPCFSTRMQAAWLTAAAGSSVTTAPACLHTSERASGTWSPSISSPCSTCVPCATRSSHAVTIWRHTWNCSILVTLKKDRMLA